MSLSILLRRIKHHIHFRLPNASTRRELFTLHRVNPDRVTADYAVLAGLSRGLSGGDILNVCVNAIYAGSVDSDSAKWVVTQGMLERETAKVKKAKAEHSGEKEGAKRRIGFGVG
jgi:ATP-dependent 26S proteasome regulatory subunit